MPEITDLTLMEAAGALRAGGLSSEGLARACLSRIQALDGQVHAFLHVAEELALEQAQAADRRLAAWRRAAAGPPPPLAGRPLRPPASFCGATGLKPSYGRVSRYGLIAYGSSLDTVGALARSAADLAPIFTTIAGHDPLDSTSMPEPAPDVALDGLEGAAPLQGLRIGVPRGYFIEGMQPAVEAAGRPA